MSNGIKIGLLSILSLLLLGLMFFLIFNKNFSWFNRSLNSKELFRENYDLSDIKEIKTDLSSTDIIFEKSQNDRIEVVINGSEKDRFNVSTDGGSLRVKKESRFCFGFCFSNDLLVIKVPDKYEGLVDLVTVSGDVEIKDDFALDFTIKTVSGDIEGLSVNNLDAKTTSGEIKVDRALNINLETVSGDIDVDKASNVSIKTTSGDITLGELELNENGNINTTSGDIKIGRVNDVYIDVDTVSGDIDVAENNRKASYELRIKSISGDIRVG